jgi:hypothetical protein
MTTLEILALAAPFFAAGVAVSVAFGSLWWYERAERRKAR